MFFSQVVFFLAVLFAMPASLRTFKLEDFGSVTRTFALEGMLNKILLSLKPRNKFMDVFVPPDCLKNNAALFKDFLNSRTESYTLWTDGEKHYAACTRNPCLKFRQMFISIIYLICGEYDLQNMVASTSTDYIRTLFIVMESAQRTRHDPELFPPLPFLPPLQRASGRHVITLTNSSVSLIGELETHIIRRNTNFAVGMREERRQKLRGSCIRLICTTSYACEHPSFNVTIQLLMHRNASVIVVHYKYLSSYKDEWYLSTIVNNMGDGSAHRNIRYTLNAVHHFGSAGFSFYVRKRDRVPKEAILVLPFSWEVWVGLLASCLLLVLTYSFVGRVMLMSNAKLSVFIFPLLAALFQQSVQLHSSLLLRQLSRFLYGLMALMFVVMSTAFKGRLTSLLNDLPLQGEAPHFVSFEDIIRRGNRLCILDHPGRFETAKPGGVLLGSPIKVGYRCYHSSNSDSHSRRSIKIATDGKDTFFTCNSRTGPSEALRRELLGRGYVETEGTAFSYPVGPEMRSSSVYRHDFAATLSRGIEAGLYVRHASLAEYKSRSFNEDNLYSTEGLVLKLCDLRPFFLVWCVGGTISTLAFIGEVVLARFGCRRCTERSRLVLKHLHRRKLRRVRVTKKYSNESARGLTSDSH